MTLDQSFLSSGFEQELVEAVSSALTGYTRDCHLGLVPVTHRLKKGEPTKNVGDEVHCREKVTSDDFLVILLQRKSRGVSLCPLTESLGRCLVEVTGSELSGGLGKIRRKQAGGHRRISWSQVPVSHWPPCLPVFPNPFLVGSHKGLGGCGGTSICPKCQQPHSHAVAL